MTSPGVQAVDNQRAGKRSLSYDGHSRSHGQTPDRTLAWRRWRRVAKAHMRESLKR